MNYTCFYYILFHNRRDDSSRVYDGRIFMCFSTLSTWLVVMMTFDRCVAVVRPFYHPKWRSVRATGFSIGTIFILCSLVSMPYIFTSKVSSKDASFSFPWKAFTFLVKVMFDKTAFKNDAFLSSVKNVS